MKPLSITAAWNETSAFVRREAGILLPIALALLALPAAVLQVVAPDAPPGQQPEAGAWMWLIIPMATLGALGSLTISILAIGRETVVRSAFALAFRRILPLLGAFLLLLVALMPLGLAALLFFIAGPLGVALGIFLLALGAVFIWVRVMPLSAVAAAEPIGPLAILKRSWSLTEGHFWRLLGFVLLMIVLLVVLGIAVTAIGGLLVVLIAGAPEPGNVSYVLLILLGAIVNSILSLVFTVMIARIYVQLSAAPASAPISGT